MARGKIIAFIDGDCSAAKNWLTTIARYFERRGPQIILGKRLYPATGKSAVTLFQDYDNGRYEYIINCCPSSNLAGYTNNMAVWRDVLQRVGSFADFSGGSDTELVQRCKKLMPDLCVKYAADVVVTHLEMNSAKVWFKKRCKYAAQNIAIAFCSDYRPLTLLQKMMVYRLVCQKNRYTIFKKVYFSLLLVLGNLYFLYGQLRGQWLHRSLRKKVQKERWGVKIK